MAPEIFSKDQRRWEFRGRSLRDRLLRNWWEPERPDEKSLWLLPSGSDQVGDDAVRPTPGRPYGEGSKARQGL